MNQIKLTKLEKYWILYDVGNSAFILLTASIIPIYYNSLAQAQGVSSVDYLATWGYAASICTIIVAILGPILGSLADNQGYKKPLFAISMIVGVIGCASMSFPSEWIVFLAVFVVAKIGYNTSLIFYDSMLTDISEPERMDMVSSHGYAWGYIGSCIPFIISLVFVLMNEKIGISMGTAMMIAFFINAAWWLLVTIPLLKNYHQKYYVKKQGHIIQSSFKRLFHTLKEITKNKRVLFFLLAFCFYIDGVYTIIGMATAYGSALGLDTQGLLLALLVTQIVAFPAALLFSKLSKSFDTSKLISVCIIAYTLISLFAITLDSQWKFWILATFVGMFQGAIQALSRSYFAKIIPASKSGEYFGIYDICGKGASFLGTLLMGLFAQISGNANGGVFILSILFVIGYFLFKKGEKFKE